jgi:hypothetical protein
MLNANFKLSEGSDYLAAQFPQSIRKLFRPQSLEEAKKRRFVEVLAVKSSE